MFLKMLSLSEASKERSEIYIHGYIMSASDLKARELLFDNVNRDAIINVHCLGTSDRIAEEFQCRGFADVRSFPVPGFEAWPASSDWLHGQAEGAVDR